jgi:hypothetical protein
VLVPVVVIMLMDRGCTCARGCMLVAVHVLMAAVLVTVLIDVPSRLCSWPCSWLDL